MGAQLRVTLPDSGQDQSLFGIIYIYIHIHIAQFRLFITSISRYTGETVQLYI